MQLTRTNAVFSIIALVSSFVQKNQLSGKTSIFIGIIVTHRETHKTKRGEGVVAQGNHTLAGRGQGWAHALLGCGHLGHPPTLPFGLHKAFDLKSDGGIRHIWRNTSMLRRRRDLDSGDQKFRSGTLPGGDAEEIITIVIITDSPSTIHDFPIHV